MNYDDQEITALVEAAHNLLLSLNPIRDSLGVQTEQAASDLNELVTETFGAEIMCKDCGELLEVAGSITCKDCA